MIERRKNLQSVQVACVMAMLTMLTMLGSPAARAGTTEPVADWMRGCNFGAPQRADTGNFGQSVAMGDFNDDGYADLAVGGPKYEEGPVSKPEESKIVVFLGSATGLSQTPYWHSQALTDSGALNGYRMAVGDVNGDGYSDILSAGSSFIFAGDLRLYTTVYNNTPFTSTPASGAPPDWEQYGFFGNAAPTNNNLPVLLADLNGDGCDDVISGAFIWYTDPKTGLPPADPKQTLKHDAMAVANVNGDLYPDIITRFGVYFGSALGIAHPANPPDNPVSPASTIIAARAGDVNGDGFDDVLFGYEPVTIYFGSANGLSDAVRQTVNTSHFTGMSMASAGRFNSDRFDDIILGIPGYYGQALVYYGRINAATDGLTVGPTYKLVDPANNGSGNSPGQFGASVASGLIRGASHNSAIVVGAPQEGEFDAAGNYTGYAYAFYGPETVNPDLDGDGLPDAWEILYGGTNLFSWAGDFDGDRSRDSDEYIAGTNPTDPKSVLAIVGLVGSSSNVVLAWPSVAGRVYSVYHTTNLLDGFKNTLATGIPYAPSAMNIHTVRTDNAGIRHFYKAAARMIIQ